MLRKGIFLRHRRRRTVNCRLLGNDVGIDDREFLVVLPVTMISADADCRRNFRDFGKWRFAGGDA